MGRIISSIVRGVKKVARQGKSGLGKVARGASKLMIPDLLYKMATKKKDNKKITKK